MNCCLPYRPRRSAGWVGIVLAVLFQFACSNQATALDPTKSIFQYNCRNWDRQSGLPANNIPTIAQSQDGYLWLGTQNGLVQFDGLNFKVVPIDLPQDRAADIQSLSSTPDGNLLVAIKFAGFRIFDGQHFTPVPGLEELPDSDVNTIFQSQDGAIWFSSTGLEQRPPGKPAHAFFDPTNTVYVTCIRQDSSGKIWFGTVSQGLFYVAGGKCVAAPDKSLAHDFVSALVIDHKNHVWVGTQRGLQCYDSNGRTVPIPAFNSEVKALLIDRHGDVWIGSTANGLSRFQNGAYTGLRKSDGLVSDSVVSLLEDQEGSIWVGTQDGLSQLTDVKFPIYSAHEGFASGSAHSVAAAKNGGLWFSTADGFCFYDGATTPKYADEKLLPNPYVKLIFEDRRGYVYWVDAAKNICIASGGRLSARIANDSWPTSFAEDDESVVVGVGDSLLRIKNGQIIPYQFKDGSHPPFYWINNLCVARHGAIWVASNNGIFSVKDGKYQQWSASEGFAGKRVQSILEDIDGSVWAGLTSGLARIKNGQVRFITHSDGLEDDRIYAIVPDDYGSFWISCGRGILRVSRQNLNDFADGKTGRISCETFNGLESIKTIDRNDQENSGCRTRDGRIWFPTPQGVAMINPANFFTNTVPPSVLITDVLWNDQPATNRTSLIANDASDHVELRFSALSFIAPLKIKIRYQLQGLDRSWIDAGDRRSAVYGNLKPGQYLFQVQAANADGIWNTNGASISLAWPAPFYQTTGFILASGLAVLLALFGIYLWLRRHIEFRQRKLQAEKDFLKTEVDKRTRELAGANDALRHSLSLLNATLDSTPDGIAVWDRAGKMVSSNCKLAAMWGASAEMQRRGDYAELTGWAAQQICHPEEFRKQVELRQARMEAEAMDTFMLKDGRVFERYVRPQLSGGDCIGQVVIYRDITARRQAEAELAFERDLLRSVLDNSVDSIYFKDAQSRFILSGTAQARQLGAALANDLVGKTDFDFFSAEYARSTFEDEQSIIRTGQPIIGKIEKLSWNDGRKDAWVLTTKMPWRNKEGQIVGTFGITKDISAIKDSEAKLREVHQQLLETSRQAGMAEVAASVLHNIGNVLNSVNISATLVADIARNSKASYVGKISALLAEHAAGLGSFLTDDPKGRQLPGYLGQLAEQLGRERQNIITEVELLRKNIDHIKDIVAMQQSYAKISGVTETVNVSELVEDALRMNEGALDRHKITLIRDYDDLPPVVVEKHKVLQILVNLIRNAKYACDESARPDKQLRIQISSANAGVSITLIDNGIGIPPENLPRIFNLGFSTRTGGHGFGLHSGALAARELGGSLSVQSQGSQQGATFVLALPLQPPKTES